MQSSTIAAPGRTTVTATGDFLRYRLGRWVVLAVTTIFAIIVVAPFAWTVSTSHAHPDGVFQRAAGVDRPRPGLVELRRGVRADSVFQADSQQFSRDDRRRHRAAVHGVPGGLRLCTAGIPWPQPAFLADHGDDDDPLAGDDHPSVRDRQPHGIGQHLVVADHPGAAHRLWHLLDAAILPGCAKGFRRSCRDRRRQPDRGLCPRLSAAGHAGPGGAGHAGLQRYME